MRSRSSELSRKCRVVPGVVLWAALVAGCQGGMEPEAPSPSAVASPGPGPIIDRVAGRGRILSDVAVAPYDTSAPFAAVLGDCVWSGRLETSCTLRRLP